ncbi:hypothetical protein [Streptomyces sp. NPDC088554]|uniref:hypothetical protein n=1 Tax=Streptomyces sp. NPDC088554 TaxID=3365865 RepID=UPI0037FBF5FC
MTDWGFVVESVTTALAGLLVSDAYASARPRLSVILNRSRNDEGVRIEDLDRLRGTDTATLRSAVHEHVHRLAASDEHLLRQLRDALGASQPHPGLNIYDNQFYGPTQMGGTQVVHMGGGT